MGCLFTMKALLVSVALLEAFRCAGHYTLPDITLLLAPLTLLLPNPYTAANTSYAAVTRFYLLLPDLVLLLPDLTLLLPDLTADCMPFTTPVLLCRCLVRRLWKKMMRSASKQGSTQRLGLGRPPLCSR